MPKSQPGVSGDEFVFLCEDLAVASDVELLMARIAAAFGEPFQLAALALTVGASVGAALAGREAPMSVGSTAC